MRTVSASWQGATRRIGNSLLEVQNPSIPSLLTLGRSLDKRVLIHTACPELNENEQDGDPVVVRDGEQFPGGCLADGERENHLSLEDPIGSMLTAKVHVFSDSVLCTFSRCSGDSVSASKN